MFFKAAMAKGLRTFALQSRLRKFATIGAIIERMSPERRCASCAVVKLLSMTIYWEFSKEIGENELKPRGKTAKTSLDFNYIVIDIFAKSAYLWRLMAINGANQAERLKKCLKKALNGKFSAPNIKKTHLKNNHLLILYLLYVENDLLRLFNVAVGGESEALFYGLLRCRVVGALNREKPPEKRRIFHCKTSLRIC